MGGASHTIESVEEQRRIEDSAGILFPGSGELYGTSAPFEVLSGITQESEREMLRIARAVHSFAALGLGRAELQEGVSRVRGLFRRRSLIVHPDKAPEALKLQAAKAFAKLERAASAITEMLSVDQAATLLLVDLNQA